MSVPARARCVPLLLAASLVSACGTTVSQTGAVAGGAAQAGLGAPAAAGDGLGGPGGAGAAPGAVGPGGAPLTGAAGPAAASAAGGAAAGPATGPSAVGAAGASAGGSGPGVTAKEIYVGLIHDENAGALNEAAGLGSITTGDMQANNRAVINDINKRGGIAGRKLVPVYAKFDSTSTQTIDQQYAAICEKFTTDQPRVFAVVGEGTESYRQCITKAGVVILSDSLPSVGAAELKRYPSFIEMGYPNIDRLAAHHVKPLVEQKYFTPWDTVRGAPAAAGAVKVGIYTYDDRDFSTAVDRYLVPALRRLGYEPDVRRIAQVNTASDYSAQAAAVKSAQLAFAANGITHVIPFEGNGGLSVFFLANARSQGYYPRYGISTASGFQALLETGAYDQRQMNGAMGFGWIPSVDLPAKYNPDNGPYANEQHRYCLKVMKENGITFDSGNAKAIALSTCAVLYLLKTSLDETPAKVTWQTFIAVTESLGTSYQKAGGLGQQFAPGRHDPSNKSYHWRYFTDCGCFHYDGALRTVA